MPILEKNLKLISSFSGANVGFFLGSFDPIHNGHISTINYVIENKICDFVIIYCVNGRSHYKKRSNFFQRTKKCEVLFKNNNKVFITYLLPAKLQKILNKKYIKYSAIIGSDIALQLANICSNNNIEPIKKRILLDYMNGIKINDTQHYKDSIICSSIIRAENFIVSIRECDCNQNIPETLLNRPIIAQFYIAKTAKLSSSNFK